MQSKLQQSKDAYLNEKRVPIHDLSTNIHLKKSDIQLIGKDHCCITTHLKNTYKCEAFEVKGKEYTQQKKNKKSLNFFQKIFLKV